MKTACLALEFLGILIFYLIPKKKGILRIETGRVKTPLFVIASIAFVLNALLIGSAKVFSIATILIIILASHTISMIGIVKDLGIVYKSGEVSEFTRDEKQKYTFLQIFCGIVILVSFIVALFKK